VNTPAAPARGAASRAISRTEKGAETLVEHRNEDEERRCVEAMVDHLQDPRRQRLAAEGERSDHDEAQVRQRRVRDEALQVTLHRRHDRAVDDADRPELSNSGRERDDSLGKQGEVETDDAVGRRALAHDPARSSEAARAPPG